MRRVLVTGGTGFLGRRLGMTLGEEFEVFLAGRNHKLAAEAAALTGCRVLPMDVCRIESVRDAFAEVKPDVVVHAAATKFVDVAERRPLECVDVNVTGSENVARVALEREARSVVGVSTDKASPPVRNTYGLTKALMERMFCTLDREGGTRLACVRYGNVAWSTGSVLPVWEEMHRESGVIRSTGPAMRRFVFSVAEAVDLVRTAIECMDEIGGGVLATETKAVLIRDLLETWTSRLGGSWEEVAGRQGDREDEHLVGEPELPFASRIAVGEREHYLIRFAQRSPEPLEAPISSATAERLSGPEMAALIESERE
jgi:UDP-N-acetylglucosamine 4,6-dehydratase/5-epimerase